jgi:hypothetical protein
MIAINFKAFSPILKLQINPNFSIFNPQSIHQNHGSLGKKTVQKLTFLTLEK